MRVLVTVEAALQFEVGLTHMALAAQRDGFLDCRRMSDMTACAPDVLVLASVRPPVGRRIGMTLHTVVV